MQRNWQNIQSNFANELKVLCQQLWKQSSKKLLRDLQLCSILQVWTNFRKRWTEIEELYLKTKILAVSEYLSAKILPSGVGSLKASLFLEITTPNMKLLLKIRNRYFIIYKWMWIQYSTSLNIFIKEKSTTNKIINENQSQGENLSFPWPRDISLLKRCTRFAKSWKNCWDFRMIF